MARRQVATLAVGVLVIAGVGACTPDVPDPTAEVRALAAGISAGDLTDVALAGAADADATAELTAAFAGLEPVRPVIEVGEPVVESVDGATSASAPLEYTWDLDDSDQDWSYTTMAHLELVDDAWQVRWTPFVLAPDLVAGETLVLRRATAERAVVLGAGGAVLVESRPVLRIGIDKMRVDAAALDASARSLAVLLDLDADAYTARVVGAGEKAFVEALVVRAGEPGVDLAAVALVPGAVQLPDELPLAPTRSFARALLGVAGPATAEIVEESDGAVVAGDVTGLSGLQHQYDEQLRGLPGLTVAATTADGVSRDLYSSPPVAGEPLRTTLEPALQSAAEVVLDPVVPASAIVAIRSSTGEVLAAASGPGSAGFSTATLGTVAPGSVFKVASSLALLRAGLTPESTVTCPVAIDVDGRTFENFPGYPAAANGTITLQTALANSCNTAFIGARDLAPQPDLAAAAASLGIGAEIDLGFPAFLGSVPTEASETEHAASMIGQGAIQVSPLAMAAAAASIGNGSTVVPWLVGDAAPASDGPATTLGDSEAASVRAMMRAVVTDGGADLLRDVPGEPVLAKTGTAQFGDTGDLRNHAWMIAVQGDLAVAVYVEEGEYGSTTAGPLLKQFLTLAQG